MGNLDIIPNRETIVPATSSYELLPKGKYSAFIQSAELKDSANGRGLVLHAVFKLTEPGFEGREIRHWYNVLNENVQAQEIGQGQLSATGKACGFAGIPSDTSELLERALVISVTVKEGKGTNPITGEPYKPSNAINGWAPIQTITAAPKVAAKRNDDDVPDDF